MSTLEYVMKGAVDNIARAAINVLVPTKPPHQGYSNVFIQTKLAVEFGNEQSLSGWVKSLDTELATASFFAVKEIKEKKAYAWEDVVAAFNNCDALVPVPDSHKRKVENWSRNSTDFFNFDGSPDSEDVKKLESWFKKIINDLDPKIYENSELVRTGVVTKLAKIACETGARCDSFEHFFANTESHRDRVLEISIIRFPIKTDPHVLLYRLLVDAWYKCERVLFVEENKAGFEVDVQEMKFKLNPQIASSITDEYTEKFKRKLEDPKTFEW